MAIKVRKKCRRQARAGVALVMAAVGALGVATVPGPGAWAQDGETDTADAPRLQRDADAVRDTGASGLVVRTEDGAGRVRQAWSGVADLDEGGRIPFDAYYRIGSDTKTFVAVVALQLVSEGTLRLDDTVEKWLPGMVAGHGNDGSRITVRDLLQHTSGLADYTDVLFGDPADLTPERFRSQRFTARTPEQQVALAMSRPPGWLPEADASKKPEKETRWAYSNTNYVLTGLIIERVTGSPWAQEVHERIIEPLGLRHTLTLGTSAYVPRPTATAYTQFPGRDDLTDTTVSVDGGADGGIVSTTADMNTFLRALMTGALLPADQLKQMRTTVPAPGMAGSDEARYGLGIAWRPAEGCDHGVWYHGGTSFGTVSEAAVTPDGRASAAAAVFTTRYGDKQRFTDQVAATIRLIDKAVCGGRR